MSIFSALRATKKYASQFSQLLFTTLTTGEVVSRAGFGCYRIGIGNNQFEHALRKALLSGINLVDTSTNYAFGDSERLVGKVIEDLEDEGTLELGAAFIVTKAGYIQGDLLDDAIQGEREGRRIPGVVKYADGVWHSIHPKFLAVQLDASLERMNRLNVNVFLLHNPEYYLSWAVASGIPLEEARAEFYRRIRMAFEYCEKAVGLAKISWYGVSSNTFTAITDNPQFCSLEECLKIAEDIAGSDHHFRFAQMPFNLLETGAATVKNQRENTMTTLEFAKESGVNVLINRPLNALSGEQTLVRLITPKVQEDIPAITNIREQVRYVINHEKAFFEAILPYIGLPAETGLHLRALLSAGAATQLLWEKIKTASEWQTVANEQLKERAVQAISLLQDIPNDGLAGWLSHYVALLQQAWNSIHDYYLSLETVPAKISVIAKESFDNIFTEQPLTQIALQAVMFTDGVSCVLTGSRSEEYVDDVVGALSAPENHLTRTHWESYLHHASQRFSGV